MTLKDALARWLLYPRSAYVERQTGRLWQMQHLVAIHQLGLWDTFELDDTEVVGLDDIDALCNQRWHSWDDVYEPVLAADLQVWARIGDIPTAHYESVKYLRCGFDSGRIWCDDLVSAEGERRWRVWEDFATADANDTYCESALLQR